MPQRGMKIKDEINDYSSFVMIYKGDYNVNKQTNLWMKEVLFIRTGQMSRLALLWLSSPDGSEKTFRIMKQK